jgi:hypothetical protein
LVGWWLSVALLGAACLQVDRAGADEQPVSHHARETRLCGCAGSARPHRRELVAQPLLTLLLCGLAAFALPNPALPNGHRSGARATVVAARPAAGAHEPGNPTDPIQNRRGPAPLAIVDRPVEPVAPVAVALDRALTRPQPADSARTLSARTALAAAQARYGEANQRYDLAAAAVDAAGRRLAAAQRVAESARATANRSETDLGQLLVGQYETGNPVPVTAQVLLSADGGDVLDAVARGQQLAAYQSTRLQRALDAQRSADRAQAEVAAAQTGAVTAQTSALDAQRAAAGLAAAAQRAVAALHLSDLAAAAKAAAAAAMVAGTAHASGADNAAGAAAALRAEVIASGAASPAAFPVSATVPAVIAAATRALLDRAAGRGPSGPATSAVHVTGRDDLGGTVPWHGRAGAGPSRALTVFDGVLSAAGWPNAGVGSSVPGTAPLLKADGVSVHPALPALPKGYRPLRAQVAVEAALGQLGSPYVWNAAGPATFDCSGLTVWAWGHAGVALEHYTGTQVTQGVRVDADGLLPGDLLLFGAALHHVGLYLGAGYMIDAPQTGDYVKVQRVADMGDFAVAVRP